MLENNGQTRQFGDKASSLGFHLRDGSPSPGGKAAVALIPEELAGAEQSVCGVKGFLVDEARRFPTEDGGHAEVNCAKVACLDIIDSPVHVHGETLETYHILSGNGRMVLDTQVVAVQAGSFIVIPPGTEHGLLSDDPNTPLRVVMTFTPGLAPVQQQAFRDERIVHHKASTRVAELAD